MLGRIDWKPSLRQLRSFAISLAVASLLFGLLLLILGHSRLAVFVAAVGLPLACLSFLIAPFGRVVYLGWMGLSYGLGRIVSPVIEALIFYLVVTPVGVLRRLIGRDSLRLKRPDSASSHFSRHSDISDREHFKRQF